MTTIYGISDDLIEFEGDVTGEVSHRESKTLIICSDGTLALASYGKDDLGIWQMQVLKKGILFDRIIECSDEDAERYSDQIVFRDGLRWAFAAQQWERVG